MINNISERNPCLHRILLFENEARFWVISTIYTLEAQL